MKKYKFVVQLGTAEYEEIIEDDFTEEELDETLQDIVGDQIDAYYEEVEE